MARVLVKKKKKDCYPSFLFARKILPSSISERQLRGCRALQLSYKKSVRTVNELYRIHSHSFFFFSLFLSEPWHISDTHTQHMINRSFGESPQFNRTYSRQDPRYHSSIKAQHLTTPCGSSLCRVGLQVGGGLPGY